MEKTPLALIIILFLFYILSATVFAYDNFETRNIKMENGRIKGEFCNKGNQFFNEVFINATAVDSSGNKLWTKTILIDKVAPYQCSHFFKIADILNRPHKLNFSYFIGKDAEFLDSTNRNQDIFFDNISINGRELEASICNRSERTVNDHMLSIFGLNNREIEWRKNIIINELLPSKCQEVTRHIFSMLFEKSSRIMFLFYKVISNKNVKFGKISDELSYKDISFKDKRFKGKICNDSTNNLSNLFIRFYALSRRNNIIWNEVISFDYLGSGECQPFIEYTLKDKKPNEWAFTVSGW